MGQIELSLTVLLSGMVVVFSVLIILTILIKAYGSIIFNSTNKNKAAVHVEKDNSKETDKVSQKFDNASDVESGIPLEVVAAISAAVEYVYSNSPNSYTIKSIKRRNINKRSSWGTAGLIDNTSPF